MPKMLNGGVAISAIPTDLEKRFIKVYFHLLPSMGVSRNINQLLRMLPQMFQGLGLLNPNIKVKVQSSLISLLKIGKISSTYGWFYRGSPLPRVSP
jgi:hypothetical protein